MGILSTCFETYSGSWLTCFKKLIFKVIMPGVFTGSGDKETNLMKVLLNQRPKRVSHLLKDNLPGNSEFYFCHDNLGKFLL